MANRCGQGMAYPGSSVDDAQSAHSGARLALRAGAIEVPSCGAPPQGHHGWHPASRGRSRYRLTAQLKNADSLRCGKTAEPLCAELARWESGAPGEESGEVGRIGVSDPAGDDGDGQVGLRQEFLGPVESDRQEVVLGAATGQPAYSLAQFGQRHSQPLGVL